MKLVLGVGHICSELIYETKRVPVNWKQNIYLNMEASLEDLGIPKDLKTTLTGGVDAYSSELHKKITKKIIRSFKKLT